MADVSVETGFGELLFGATILEPDFDLSRRQTDLLGQPFRLDRIKVFVASVGVLQHRHLLFGVIHSISLFRFVGARIADRIGFVIYGFI